MIKCNVTIVGTVSKAAQMRQNKEGKPFITFGVDVVLLNPNGINRTMEISVIKDGAGNTADYVLGSRIKLAGELTFRKRGDNLYFNFSGLQEDKAPDSTEDSIKGELTMKGTVGKNIDVKTTKSGKNMLIFSAYSSEKTNDGFAFTWVRFVQFNAARPDWLQPKSTIEAKGELEISIFNDRVSLGCKLAELKQWDKPVYSPRDAEQKLQGAAGE